MAEKVRAAPAKPPGAFEGPVAKELEALETGITADISQRNKLKTFLKKLKAASDKQEADSLSKLLSDPSLSQLVHAYPQAKPAIDLLAARVGFLRDTGIRNVETRLREYCEAHRLKFHGGPRKFVVEHFIELDLGAAKAGLKIGNARVKVTVWENVRRALENERQRIWGRPFDAGQFKREVLGAYSRIAQLKKNPTGWVRLHDIYQELKSEKAKAQKVPRERKRLIPYFRDEFGADISKLLEQETRASGRRSFELSAIRDPRFAFKIIMPGGSAGSFGFLRPARDGR